MVAFCSRRFPQSRAPFRSPKHWWKYRIHPRASPLSPILHQGRAMAQCTDWHPTQGALMALFLMVAPMDTETDNDRVPSCTLWSTAKRASSRVGDLTTCPQGGVELASDLRDSCHRGYLVFAGLFP